MKNEKLIRARGMADDLRAKAEAAAKHLSKHPLGVAFDQDRVALLALLADYAESQAAAWAEVDERISKLEEAQDG